MARIAVDYESPGAQLRRLLHERDMTQAELARLTGYSAKHINELCWDHSAITPSAAIRLERALGVSADVFNKWATVHADRSLREAERIEEERAAQLAAARAERRQTRKAQTPADRRRKR